MRIRFTTLLLIFTLGVLPYAAAQETPYYEPPSQRKLTNHEIALPNLKTEKVFWYFSANAGIKWTGHKITDNLGGRIVGEKQVGTYWEGNVGINRNDKWQLEFGYINNPTNLIWQLFETNSRNRPITFGERHNEHTLSGRYKKRMLILDKVTKNSRLNLTAGINFSPYRKTETLQVFDVKIPTSLSRNGFQDTLYIQTNFNQKASPISGEIGIELISRLANPIEIGVYTKYIFSQQGIINSDINIDSYLGKAGNTHALLNGSDFILGFTLRWNFLHGTRYLPDIK
jgi:hypothetical protein